MENKTKKIIEINGIKMEVDLRDAKVVDSYKVGDRVKVLRKSYPDSYESFIGTIIGFDEFRNLPTIIIAYITKTYSSDADIKFVYLNSQSKDIEICKANENELYLDKESIAASFEQAIKNKRDEIKELEQKRDIFLKNFGQYFNVRDHVDRSF